MHSENGNISIHTENIFPIIKKWLYSDKDIFVRELISNGCDAITKLKRLQSIGEAKIDENEAFQVKVIMDNKGKTIQFIDNGIGMTSEEVKKYINQVAFSGAEDFISKYKEKTDEASQIIGHFGLGFYSAFMVSDRVQIDTLSYQQDAEAVRWICNGGTEYEITESDRAERGTTITLYIGEDSTEFLSSYKLREIIEKYCYFLPVEIYLEDVNEKKDEKKNKENRPLNDIHPLWMKRPEECTDEEYKEFYRKVFFDFNEPLFWIHLHVDYPFNLKGILYFPKLKHELESIEGQIKLYNNQVFVADNIKEVIPEFLLLLKGTIDCSDLPLNVSRSFLQKDSNVIKISQHITKKVGDKLIELFKNERDKYNGFWDDINPFIKYGCLRDSKFYDRVKDIIIFKTTKGDYITLKDYLERNKENHENKVFYVTDEKQQAQYIRIFEENGMEALVLNSSLDNHFITFLEMQEKDLAFSRVDSDLSEALKSSEKEGSESDKEFSESAESIFKSVLGKDKLTIKTESLKSAETPAVILLPEQSRRMQEMSSMFGGMDLKNNFPEEHTLVLNKNNNLIKSVVELNKNPDKKENLALIVHHVYDLAMMSHKQLEPEAMTEFIKRSNQILGMIIG